ncbi:PIN domain-containing protein [Altererythrobacter aquiaggeris]|uniref:PIN domain-containing protein n=1 Tax=Aestuarierythrobacter aquiaggeris TaxID=1898396 RepID=UPI00301840FD
MNAAIFDSAILVDALVGLSTARTEIVRTPERWITRLGWTEILAGASGDAERVEQFLDHFKVAELSEDIARRGASLREQRANLALADAITLATAQITGRILVTRNANAFPAEMPGIRIPYTL